MDSARAKRRIARHRGDPQIGADAMPQLSAAQREYNLPWYRSSPLSLAWSRDQLSSKFGLVTLPTDQGYALETSNFRVNGETGIVKLQSDRNSLSKTPRSCHLRESLAVFFLASAFLFFPSNANAQAANIYIAQNATGAGTGGSCADALAVSFFNSSGNWGRSEERRVGKECQ